LEIVNDIVDLTLWEVIGDSVCPADEAWDVTFDVGPGVELTSLTRPRTMSVVSGVDWYLVGDEWRRSRD
jgi:hypothetical protein